MRAVFEIIRPTMTEAKDAADERVTQLCADGWRFIGARFRRLREPVVELYMEREGAE